METNAAAAYNEEEQKTSPSSSKVVGVVTDIGSCCFCSLSSGTQVSGLVTLGWTIAHLIFTFAVYHENYVYWVPWLREADVLSELVYWGPMSCWVLGLISGCLALLSGGDKTRTTKKQLITAWVVCLLLLTIAWTAYGIHFSIRLKKMAFNMLPGHHLGKWVMKQKNHTTTKKAVATAAILTVNPAADVLWTEILPWPLNAAYFAGMHIWLPLAVLAFVPLCINVPSLFFGLAYKSVIDTGGDGTENVCASDLERFNNLSFEEQDMVREGIYTLEQIYEEIEKGQRAGFYADQYGAMDTSTHYAVGEMGNQGEWNESGHGAQAW